MANTPDESGPGEGAEAAHTADRPPTEEEERAAERSAADVDLEDVAKHEREMGEIGANVKGEGQI